MSISAHYEEIAHCNHCGFCQTACPIFRSTGYEGGSRAAGWLCCGP